jgi:hypothetical protein
MRLIYPGPSDGVDLLLPAGGSQPCLRGEPLEVPDELVDQLLAQGWTEPAADQPPTSRRRRKTTTTTVPDAAAGLGQED